MSTFLDEAEILVSSGKGGDGAASFHREKHVPRGGPDGADGGRGGDVVLVADRGKRTLYDFKLRSEYKAGDGVMAHSNKRGRDGESIEISVPVGTVVTDVELGETLADMAIDGMRFTVCRGGRGGLGNLHFTSSVRQAPTFAQKGAPGESVRIRLELKLLADVGLVGLPNAGKSTLLSVISAAQPKIGDYPFTTIAPNIGVVTAGNETFVVADLPGLIEGASEGRGLGHRFLRHAERTKALIHLVDCFPLDGTTPLDNFRIVQAELEAYSPDLAARPTIVAVGKIDLVQPEDLREIVESFSRNGTAVSAVSAATGKGVRELMLAALSLVREAEKAESTIPVLVPSLPSKQESAWDAEKRGGTFVVTGERIERLVAMTDLRNRDALHYLHRKLERIGVIPRLRELGIEDGDTVRIGDWVFDYQDW